MSAASWIEVVGRQARERPEKQAFLFLEDGEREAESLTFGALEVRARALGAALQETVAPGERALLLVPPGLAFVEAFLGCLYAGVVAVPAYPPSSARGLPRLATLAVDARPTVVLTTAAVRPRLAGLGLPCLAVDEVDDGRAAVWRDPGAGPETLAFLQYTSGSTSDPKGVEIRHRQLLHNEEMIRTAFGQSEESVIVGWLPLYHDMGLIGTVLQPLYSGARCVLMAPTAFLQRPRRWLAAVSHYRATTSGGPDFAWDLCVRRIPEPERAGLDLSSWQVAFSGAEPVRAATLERFAAAFAGCGFRREAFYPCYGLAEATLFVAGGRVGEGAASAVLDTVELEQGQAAPVSAGAAKPVDLADRRATELVACGTAWSGQRLAIVDPASASSLPDGLVGEIWVAGPSVAAGYWGREEESVATFRARFRTDDTAVGEGLAYLRTGDLGFVQNGALFVTGRLKDLIILRGRNLYPQDLEHTAERSHPALRPGSSAAFSVEDGAEGGERLVIAAEVEPRARLEPSELAAVADAVRRAVAEEHEARVSEVVLLAAGVLPKTTSGKVRRGACRSALAAGELAVLERSALSDDLSDAPAPRDPALNPTFLLALPEPERAAALLDRLRTLAAGALRLTAGRLDPDLPLSVHGLDSLQAAELRHAIETELGVSLALAELIEGPSLTGLAALVAAGLERGAAAGDVPPVRAGGPAAELPLARNQQALWFLDRLAPESAAYVIAGAGRLLAGPDGATLSRCLAALADRHPALRTTFHAGPDGVPLQRLHDRLDPTWSEHEAAAWGAAELEEAVRQAAYRPFDLAAGPLLRGALFDRGAEPPVLLLAVHHLVGDLASLEVLLRELAALARGEELSPPPAFTYADFVRWQAELLAGPAGERLWDYWRTALAGDDTGDGSALPVLALPADRERPPVQTFTGAMRALPLAPVVSAGLGRLAREHGATLFALLLAAFQVVLHRWTGQDDLLITTPTSGRAAAGLDGVVGYFVNPVVLRGRIAFGPGSDRGDGPTFAALLDAARATALGAFRHQDFPFPLLAERLQPERDPARPPLSQAMLVLQRPGRPGEEGLPALAAGAAGALVDLGGLRLESVALAQPAQLDLTLFWAEEGGSLRAFLFWNRDLFDPSTALRLLTHQAELLAALVRSPGPLDIPALDLPLLGAAERHQILVERSDTAAPTGDGLVHQLVAAWAARAPGAPALQAGELVLSYAEVIARAGALARRLAWHGAGPEERVAVCLERTPELPIALLAVLQSGAAYLPLDPLYPADRLALMLADSGARLLVTTAALAGRLSLSPGPEGPAGTERPAGPRVVLIEATAAADEEAEPRPALPENPAYVLYTSGSTGVPKGVVVPHRAVTGYLVDVAGRLGLAPGDRLLQFHSPSFDVSFEEIFATWTAGATVVVAPVERLAAPAGLVRLLAEERITCLGLPTAYWHDWIHELRSAGAVPPAGLRYVIIGGEAVATARLAEWRDFGIELVHGYGLTETAVTSTLVRIPAAQLRADLQRLPLGRPLDNVRLELLAAGGGAGGRPVPLGAAGEIYLGGRGVARGYLGRPALTAERFVPDPRGGPGARWFRTGDLARCTAAGALEFLGRVDRQVKVRGFRLEPGEIEAALAALPGVRDAVVVVAKDPAGGARLVAYVAAGPEVTGGAVRTALAARLPAHLVPAAVVVLDRLPLNAHGKVDRRALPPPAVERVEWPERVDLPAAGGATARALAALWAELLGLDRVGRDESFFDLGGHSLLLARMQAEIARRLGREVALVDLFRHPTVGALARHLDGPEAGSDDLGGLAAAATAATRAPEPRAPIAIVGMAGRFPGAESVAALWRNLCAGVESIATFSRDELLAEGLDPALVDHPGYVPKAGFLADADCFDAELFGIAPAEAEVMDPQHRVFLECAWAALEDAGYRPDACPGRVGVYAGSSMNSYLLALLSDPRLAARLRTLQTALLSDKDFLPARVSYLLDLKGPSVAVQTACSTSLVAVHLAVQALRQGECDLALAGGVSIGAPRKAGHLWQEGGAFSPDGRCRTFDTEAAGIVTGEGAGVVVLKRLDDALADGDAIVAVLRGTAVNNDGAARVGFTAPGVDGQTAVVRAALADAGMSPDTVGYVEAHGTGTRLGDPIEVAALSRAFAGPSGLSGSAGRGGPCALGSLKTNLGHLDTAAGVAGLIKAALAVRHGVLPPSLHFRTANPAIDFAAGLFRVQTELADWPRDGAPRRAGVTSLGMGGTNVHVVLEEPPPTADAEPSSRGPRRRHLLVLSARDQAGLDRATERLAAHLAAPPDNHGSGLAAADVAFTLATGRTPQACRRALVCRDLADAAAVLSGAAPGRLLAGTVPSGGMGDRPVCFLFPGQGAQAPGMARDLYRAEPSFRRTLDHAAEVLATALGGHDLRGLLVDGRPGDDLERTDLAQPALFIIEVALGRLFQEWGVRPAALLGHSVGEYAAACIAGVFSFEDGLALVAERGRLMQAMPRGAMLAVPLPEAELAPLLGIQLDGSQLDLAAVNGPAFGVVSGPEEAIARLAGELAARGLEVRRLRTSQAFHSAMMEPVLAPFAERLRRVELRAPRLPLVSDLTGGWLRPEEATDPAYWVRHLRQTVRFGDSLAHLRAEDPAAVLLEVGPGAALGAIARRQGGAPPAVVSVLPDRAADTTAGTAAGDEALLTALGKLWLHGVAVDWPVHAAQGGEAQPRRTALPGTSFERRRFWIAPRPAAQAVAEPGPDAGRPVDRSERLDPAEWFWVPSWRRTPPAALLPRTDAPGTSPGWLVFLDELGVGEALAGRLRSAGRPVATVRADAGFARLGDGSYQLDPTDGPGYAALLAVLGPARPRVIAHLWSLTGEPSPEEGPAGTERVARLQEIGFGSLLRLAGALAATGWSGPLTIGVVADGLFEVQGGERLCPEKATLLGPTAALPRELPGVSCRAVDLAFDAASDPAGLDDAGRGRWADLLFDELEGALDSGPSAKDATTAAVAYRGAHRWRHGFAPLRLDPATTGPAALRERGVYLVAGGLGRLGLAIAEHLARAVRARLVLADRAVLPAREQWDAELAGLPVDHPLAQRLRAVQRLEELGAEVLVLAVDITDRAALSTALAAAHARFGPLHGAFHAAGVTENAGSVRHGEATAAAEVLGPKLLGTRALAAELTAAVAAGQGLDFFVLATSAAAWMGLREQVATAAAEAAVEAFAAATGLPALALAWPAPSGGGLEEIVEPVLERALSRGLRQVLVAPHGLAAALAAPAPVPAIDAAEPTAAITTAAADRAHPRPALATPYVPPSSPVEQRIAALWEELLGVAPVGAHDDFLELGGHSLLATQLLSRLGDELGPQGARASMADFFARPTVAGLAAAIDPETATAEALTTTAELAAFDELVAGIQNLSPEEVAALLAAEEEEAGGLEPA